jgi:hypothetical protein
MMSRRFTSNIFTRPLQKYACGIPDDIRNVVRSVRIELPTPITTIVRGCPPNPDVPLEATSGDHRICLSTSAVK